jgi:Zn-dependent protease
MSGRWELLIILIPALLVSMMFHELAHGFVAYRLGDPTAKLHGRLSFNPLKHLDPLGTAMFFITYLFSGFMFGWAKPVPVSPYYFKNRQRGMALVGVVGPLTNFVLAIIFIIILNLIAPPSTGWVFRAFWLLFQVNIVLGLFNLIPIPPLDGSRVIGAFMPRNAYAKWVELDRYGWVILIAFVVLFWGRFGYVIEDVMFWLANIFLTNYTLV